MTLLQRCNGQPHLLARCSDTEPWLVRRCGPACVQCFGPSGVPGSYSPNSITVEFSNFVPPPPPGPLEPTRFRWQHPDITGEHICRRFGCSFITEPLGEVQCVNFGPPQPGIIPRYCLPRFEVPGVFRLGVFLRPAGNSQAWFLEFLHDNDVISATSFPPFDLNFNCRPDVVQEEIDLFLGGVGRSDVMITNPPL